MAQVRLSKQFTSYSPVPSPDSSSSDDAVKNELRAVSETALIAQGIELVSDLQEGVWMSTDDYSTSDADPDREDSLTTSDSKNRLTPSAEQVNGRRGDRQSKSAELVISDRELDDIGGGGHASPGVVPGPSVQGSPDDVLKKMRRIV